MDKDFFKDIKAAIDDKAALFTDEGMKPIAFIDRFRGQPLNPELFEYYPLPAIFIQRKIKWKREGSLYNCTAMLSFNVVTDPTWDVSSIAPNQNDGLNYFNFLDKVREVLDNFDSPYTSTMERVEDDDVDAEVVFYDVLTYQCEYYANTKLKPRTESVYNPSLVLDITDKSLRTREA